MKNYSLLALMLLSHPLQAKDEGFKLRISDDSLFYQAGLRNDDLMTSCGDIVMRENMDFARCGKLIYAEKQTVVIKVVRNGKPMQFTVKSEDSK